MTQNNSPKICISKRLAVISLLLITVGFSVVVFSTLSSSVNKTTSSKASGTESVAMQDFGGKNNPCAINLNTKEYYCNTDTSLVCDGPLEFWLSNKETKQKIRTDKKSLLEKGPRCIDPAEIPMGKEGQICRPAEPGKKQCDSGVCVDVFGKKPYIFSKTYYEYFISKYRNDSRLGKELFFTLDKYINDADGQYANDFVNAFKAYLHAKENNSVNTTELNGICVPDPQTTSDRCGDLGQKACLNESNQYYCFGDYRFADYLAGTGKKCEQKITITSKTTVRCDDLSPTCNEFCSGIGAKCVETCEKQNPTISGDPKKSMVTGGLLGFQHYDGDGQAATWKSGNCDQDHVPYSDSPLTRYGCSTGWNTFCCCDKKN